MTENELIDKTNEIISELVVNKTKLQKAFNYYNGKRDKEQFRYLEENCGIGSPTSVKFTPLLKKHVDALVGEFLGTPILPKVSCKDSRTISNIGREKQLELTARITTFLKTHLNKSLLRLIGGKDIVDKTIKQQLDKIIDELDQSFTSQYEIAAQNILQYIMQSTETDFVTKLRELFIDLLVTGYCYFRIKPSLSGTNIEIEVLNPLNTFVDKNPESPYVKNSNRSVVRQWLTKSQIIAKYGKELSKEDIQKMKDDWTDDSIARYRRAYGPVVSIDDDREDDEDIDLLPGYPDDDSHKYNYIPVYDVEWIETDSNYVMQRYNCIRIGEEFYILRGQDNNVIRCQDNPNYCTLTVNGVYFLNRARQPYSLILKCAHLQDQYDVLNYYRDAILANSGVKGSIIDISMIPTFLGSEYAARIQKWIAYKKQGTMLIDTAQEGRNENGNAPLNTIFNGYDESLPAQVIQAIDLTIQSIENTVSSITGVFRERLNGIEQHDAVTNIKQGVTNSFTITKPIFQQMDLVVNQLLNDCLNEAKIVYKKGITGTLILGEKYQKIFTALPEHYTLTDYDIHIISSTDIMEDMQTIKSTLPDLIKSGLVSADIIFEALTAKSLTDLKYKVQKAIEKQKEENNQMQQLQSKLEETSQQLQQAQQELQKAQQKIQQLNEQKMQLDQSKIQLEYQVNWYKAQTDRTYRTRQLDIEDERTKIELSQLNDGNPYNDKIKQM